MQHEQMMNSSLLDEHQSMMKNSVVQEWKQQRVDIQQKQNDQNSYLNHEQQLQNLKDCHCKPTGSISRYARDSRPDCVDSHANLQWFGSILIFQIDCTRSSAQYSSLSNQLPSSAPRRALARNPTPSKSLI